MSPRVRSSEYMEWAKTRSFAAFNLATSGVMNYPLSELEVGLRDLELTGASFYGWPPLLSALGRKCGVPPECVVHAPGASFANHLAMAGLVEAEDDVLIEQPAYDPLPNVALYLGARVRRFPRRVENGFRIDLRDVERALTPRTRLVALTNLHNPSGAFTDESTLRGLGELARSAGARVLVDEVYLECLYGEQPPSAFHLGPHFVATSSLTKAYGLSGLRCGFVLAEPDLARRLWRLNDLFSPVPAHPAELLSVVALAQLEKIAARAKRLLDANRQILRQAIGGHPALEPFLAEHGTVAFPRLRRGSVEALCEGLRERYDTSVVPGRFFESDDHFRVGIGGPTDALREGAARLARALDEIAK